MELTIKDVEDYFKRYNPKRREHNEEYLEAYEQHCWHFDGEYPKKLIERRRPGEHNDIKGWRESVYQPMTKAPCSKVVTSLQKIQKSPDWHVVKSTNQYPLIKEGEDLYSYLYLNLPSFQSIEKYTTDVYLRQYLTDAGAISVVLPINLLDLTNQDNEYYRPLPLIINSEYIFEFIPEKLFIWDSDTECVYNTGKELRKGFIYYALTDTHFYQYNQIDEDGNYKIEQEIKHNLEYLTAFSIGAIVTELSNNERMFETRVSGMIPNLNEAVREYSDSQAEMVQHVFSTMYTYETAYCNVCKGNGLIPSTNGPIRCNECDGKGKFPFNPFEHIVISNSALKDTPPNPPAAYIQKQTEIISIMDARFKQRIYDALSAVNMEFLAEKPISQSGVAKQYDAEELNNFVYSVAEDMIYFINMSSYFTALWRYKLIYPKKNDLIAMLPYINVPIKYEIVSDSVMLEDITRMVNAKVDATLIIAAEIEYARRKFSTNPKIAEQISSRMELDPLAGLGDDAILTANQLTVIKKEDITIHYNINKFISRAVYEIKNWDKLNNQEKYKILYKFAQEENGTLDDNGVNIPDTTELKRLDAQATLKGTVGGVQGILEIQKSVSQGITDSNAAVSLLIEIYGFSEEQANNVIGTPKVININGQPTG